MQAFLMRFLTRQRKNSVPLNGVRKRCRTSISLLLVYFNDCSAGSDKNFVEPILLAKVAVWLFSGIYFLDESHAINLVEG